MSEFVNLIIHHSRKWENPGNMVYVDGEVLHMKNVDIDFLSMFELQGYTKDIGYKNAMLMWFKIFGLSGNESYEEIESDKSVLNMLDYNRGCDFLEIYFIEVVEPVSVNDDSGVKKWDPSISNVMAGIDGNSSQGETDNEKRKSFLSRRKMQKKAGIHLHLTITGSFNYKFV